jgi:hypothetical protein
VKSSRRQLAASPASFQWTWMCPESGEADEIPTAAVLNLRHDECLAPVADLHQNRENIT